MGIEGARAALRIIADVVVYRVRRLEMANLVAAVAIMLALHTRPADLLIRGVFGFGLNLLVYLTNDYYDVNQDLAEGRALNKTRYLKQHLRAAAGAQWALVGVLACIAAVYDWGLLVPLLVGGGMCWAYSVRLKAKLGADIFSMAVCGAALPLVAFPLDNYLGWGLVLQLALFSAGFETIQVLRDHAEDSVAGVNTTAVVLGVQRTRWLLRVLLLLSAVYAVLVVDRWVGLGLMLPLFLPLPKQINAQTAAKYWDKIRLTQGLSWLALLLSVYLREASFGWLTQLGA